LGSRPGGCPGRPMACHWATGSGSAYADRGGASRLCPSRLAEGRASGMPKASLPRACGAICLAGKVDTN
jgi:hypothetical protein